MKAHHSSIEMLKLDMLSKKASRLGMAKAKEVECSHLEKRLAMARQFTKKSQEGFVAAQSKRTQVAAATRLSLMMLRRQFHWPTLHMLLHLKS